jgi:hypothetical protein
MGFRGLKPRVGGPPPDIVAFTAWLAGVSKGLRPGVPPIQARVRMAGMKIVTFAALKLHGYLDFTLRVNSDLTFLTGINGSGKTSAVRTITALLTPSLVALSEIDYAEVSVVVEHEGAEVTVSSTRLENEMQIFISTVGEEVLSVPVLKPEAYEPSNRFSERKKDFYREQEAVLSRSSVLAAIRDLPTPMFLDLERRYQDGGRTRRDPARYSVRVPLPANPFSGSLADSLAFAQGLGEDAYRDYLVRKSKITDRLKLELILGAFRRVDSATELQLGQDRLDFLSELNKTERLVLESLRQIEISDDDVTKTVTPFFENIRLAASAAPNPEEFDKSYSPEVMTRLQDWVLLQPQVRQISLLASRVKRYNAEIRELYGNIDRYLTSVNSFFADSQKRVVFMNTDC